jgi:glycosyltransferase involved in cell wall biosynthesis
VVDALALLKSRGRKALVLATGYTQDRRQSGYFDFLMRHVATCGVEEGFRVLGLLPQGDVAALMRHSVAVINPSSFEGWSTTVEEAKSLGKNVLLSGIPVHREQAPERGAYFEPNSAEGLAEHMWRTLSNYSSDEESRHQAHARKIFPLRVREFGRSYEKIAMATYGQI